MDDELDTLRAEVFELQKRAIEVNEDIVARFHAVEQQLKRRITLWDESGPHSGADGRSIREMVRSIGKLQVAYLDVRSASTKADSELVLNRLASDTSDADSKLESAHWGRQRQLKLLNSVQPELISIVSDLERLLDELDTFIRARMTIPDEPATDSYNSAEETNTSVVSPLKSLILQWASPEHQGDFERTREFKVAASQLLAKIREISVELEDQRLRLQSAHERRHWRMEQWRSIGPHESKYDEHLTAMNREIKALSEERTVWLTEWNSSLSSVIQDALSQTSYDTATRICVANQIYERVDQLRESKFALNDSLVTRIEVTSSELIEFIDENLLKNPPKSTKRIWWR